MAASPNIVSTGSPMLFTKDQATAARRRWAFYLTNAADGTPATGKTIAGADFKISKNGAAFGNAAGAVTELSLGWYVMEFAAADLDTLGALACELSGEAGVDTLHATHQVIALELNTATVNPGADGITAATLAASAGTEIGAAVAAAATVALATTGPHAMGTRTTNGSFTALSMVRAVDMDLTVTGTWNGATVTVETCADVLATVPVWSTYDDGAGPNPLTANGTVRITGPFPGVRATLSAAGGATSLTATATIRSAIG